MRVRLSDPGLLADVLDFLGTRHDVVAAQVADDEIEVSLLGSRRADANRMELELRLRAWQAAHRGSGAAVIVD